MPPNSIDVVMSPPPQEMIQGAKLIEPGSRQVYNERYGLMIVQSGVNLLAHILIGMVVAICFVFSFRAGLPLGRTSLHIVLCVIGYILLMAQAILSLTTHNGWTSRLKLVDKRRAHWIMQILGSVLAITGTFWKILDENISVHFTTLHGRFGLVALVFTVVSLVNGLASLWAYELRRFLPGTISKLTHICFGTVGFAAACICLCYGLDKNMFRNWATTPMADTTIAFVAILAFIVIVNPLITFYFKLVQIVKK